MRNVAQNQKKQNENFCMYPPKTQPVRQSDKANKSTKVEFSYDWNESPMYWGSGF